jgi:hypothetical protein
MVTSVGTVAEIPPCLRATEAAAAALLAIRLASTALRPHGKFSTWALTSDVFEIRVLGG